MVKPDGVARGLIHDIMRRWEQRGFTLVAIKVLYPDRKLAEAHYADLSARPFCAPHPPPARRPRASVRERPAAAVPEERLYGLCADASSVR